MNKPDIENGPELTAETGGGPADEPAGERQNSGQQDAPAAADPAAGGDTENELDALAMEVAQMKDQYLRAKAEAENVRRRAEMEVRNARKYALERFLVELLTVKDSLDLASRVELPVDADDAVKGMLEGLDLTLRQFDTVFAKFAVTELCPETGDRFDADLHQAVSAVESAELPANHIVHLVQKGYQLEDRLLRPAMVVVSRESA